MNISASTPSGVGAFLYESLPSTNDEARTIVASGRELPCWVLALEQTAGRGRRGRAWTGLRGNFYATLAMDAGLETDLTAFPYLAGLAMREALVQVGVSAESARCKWPNDVLVDGAKIAGILIEAEMVSGSAPAKLLIGCGVNLADAPEDTPYPATSVMALTGRAVDQMEFLGVLAQSFERWVALLQENGFAFIREAWIKVATGIGERVKANLIEGTLEGVFVGLGDDGALFLELDDGSQRKLYAGDVFPLINSETTGAETCF